MFSPQYNASTQPKKTLEDLQVAINRFATQYNVTPDIFFELFCIIAIKYYIEDYYPHIKEITVEEIQKKFAQVPHRRPYFAELNCRSLSKNINEETYHLPTGDIALNLLWQEIITAYCEFVL